MVLKRQYAHFQVWNIYQEYFEMSPCMSSYVTANLFLSILKVIDALGHEKLMKQKWH